MKTIRDYRIENGLTQEQLAEELEVDVSNVQRWEYGETDPRQRNKKRVSEFFGVAVEDICWQSEWKKGERANKWQRRTKGNTIT